MKLAEASMNFDAVNVRPFFERLKSYIETGFWDNEILQVHRMMEKLELDETIVVEFPIRYNGKNSSLRIRVYMDDVDSLDIYCITHPKLAKEIDREMQTFADQLGL